MKVKTILFFLILSAINLEAQESSSSRIDSLIQTLEKTELRSIDRIKSYLELTKIYLRINVDSAVFYVEKAKKLAKENNNVQLLATCLIEQARIKEVQNEIDVCVAYLDEAAKLYMDRDADNTYLKVCNYYGLYYDMLSNYDLAIEKYLLGLKLSVALDHRMYQAVFLSNLSLVYARINQLDKSLASILEAIAIYDEIGSRGQYFQSLIYLGSVYIKFGKYDLAVEHISKARDYFTERNDHILLADIYVKLGKISILSKNWEEALELLLSAQFYGVKMRDYNGSQNYKLGLINNSLGNIYLHLKDYKSATEAFRSSEKIGITVNSIEVLKEAYEGLYKSYLGLKKLDSVQYYLNLFIPVNNGLLIEQYNDRIDSLNYEHELGLAKSNFDLETKLIANEKKSQSILFISAMSILVLIILVVVFYWYIIKTKYLKSTLRSKNLALEKENLILELDKKNKKLTSTVLNLIERNEFISQISKSLEDINSKEQTVDLKKIKSIIHDIDRDMNKKLWQEFELRYIDVHQDFFDKLNNISSRLTSNERRLSALLVLNMSTKDISSITYQSVHSIKTARYRLRKKLGLDKNENLILFLNNLR